MEIHYEYALKQQEARNRIISAVNASEIPVVLFGWSRVKTIEVFLSHLTYHPEYLCDNDVKKQGTTLFGCKVISPDELPLIYTRYNIIVLVPKHFESIYSQLQALEIAPDNIYTLDFYNEGVDPAVYYKSNEDKIRYIHDHLADELSRKTYEAVINYRIYREESLLSEIIQPQETEYFPDAGDFIFPIGAEEVFVDGGAYCGDTVNEFLKRCPEGCCRTIHCFEPDPENFAALQKSTEHWPFVRCHPIGLSDAPATLNFCSDLGVSSYLDKTGEISVAVDALDRMLGNETVTYIKMDIEGAECAALHGARHIIQTCKPKLAICTYHLDADMVDVPLIIWGMNPQYSLYFRHYTNMAIDTVCYAILSE